MKRTNQRLWLILISISMGFCLWGLRDATRKKKTVQNSDEDSALIYKSDLEISSHRMDIDETLRNRLEMELRNLGVVSSPKALPPLSSVNAANAFNIFSLWREHNPEEFEHHVSRIESIPSKPVRLALLKSLRKGPLELVLTLELKRFSTFDEKLQVLELWDENELLLLADPGVERLLLPHLKTSHYTVRVFRILDHLDTENFDAVTEALVAVHDQSLTETDRDFFVTWLKSYSLDDLIGQGAWMTLSLSQKIDKIEFLIRSCPKNWSSHISEILLHETNPFILNILIENLPRWPSAGTGPLLKEFSQRRNISSAIAARALSSQSLSFGRLRRLRSCQ